MKTKYWHLADDESSVPLTRFESALWSTFNAFQRWEGECIKASGSTLNSNESSILNFIRMHDTPKALSDIAHFLNRDDLSNIQYSLRKLKQAKLIDKDDSKISGRDTCYKVTQEGLELTDKFAALRKELLVHSLTSFGIDPERLDQATSTMMLMSGLFESNAREAMTFRQE